MTFDERLEFLRQSTESLHESCQELHAIVVQHNALQRRLDLRERRGRQAIVAAMAAYLAELNEEGDNGTS